MKTEQSHIVDLLESLENNHPYPEDIFLPVDSDKWEKFHKVITDAGYKSSGGGLLDIVAD